MNVVKALHKLKSFTQDSGKTQFLIHFNYNIGLLAGLYYDSNLIHQEYTCFHNRNKTFIILSKYDNVINFFINNNIYHLLLFFPDTLIAFNYTHQQVAALKIIKYYRRYRYNLYKKRRDPLKRELMEYCYHPSRITF
jgi:hypothetical protein